MAEIEEVEGIVLYRRKHRERDFLVKIFTQKFGKIMFYVRGRKGKTSHLSQAIQPFTVATFIADIRDSGLSFLRGAKHVETFRELNTDIFKNAYATYICGLADATSEDHVVNYNLYQQVKDSLHLIDEGYDERVVTNILEIKFLLYFGVQPNLRACAVCGETMGVFDYSDKFHGILCSQHFFEDNRRLHVDPKAVHLIRLYSVIKLDKIGEISIKEQTQNEIIRLIDHIYNESVGLHLKSKKFIDNLYQWEDFLKEDN